MAHYHTTAQEIIDSCPDLDIFCDFVGTGGTFEGCSKRLKEYNSEIKCFIVEPTEPKHIIQGGGYFKPVPFSDDKNCDGKIAVSNEEALFWMREMSKVEAIPGGISSGANLAAAVKLIKQHPGKSIAFLVNDPSLKYLSAKWMHES
jgi:cysteine synthase A